ncbi:PhoH family protein [Aureibacter tunicatorum]|uniref:PhoH-like protein n=1 Tax=Aureibacter tunicatorum TaxID=866807 RepID=A0AAE4BT76_9BACT|nr:PhoH family protein [Aureibacter tunicatorum]MDR6239262.1 phosphate starvation-inducible PhoH-like protein [Aureibacter tunicatorum]BDD04813.1 phosphate starvation protein PhoH [Aureibacter tunicatorum]
MIEKKITLENIPLIDFLGPENKNIEIISASFPNSKIVSRGEELILRGKASELLVINDLVNKMIKHFEKFGKINEKAIEQMLKDEQSKAFDTTDQDIIVFGAKGLVVKPKSKNQKILVEAVQNNDLVFALGPAGTGKTYIAVALAVRALKNKEVKKIIITRPAVEAGENLGFLPGDLKDKIDPYLSPIYDALSDMIPSEKLKHYQENQIIEIAPLAYMRGRTLKDAFILLDEAQNTTAMQIKMFLTRMGTNSKVIVNGDESQIDLPKNQKSGLSTSINILKNVKGIGVVHLRSGDVIRHKLVRDIINAYDEFDKVN